MRSAAVGGPVHGSGIRQYVTVWRVAGGVRAIGVKRIYEPVDVEDGRRVLVDRIWPRGISRQRAALDAWMPEVAPSHELRTWFAHDPERWTEFQARYRAELAAGPHLEALVALAEQGPLTLLYSARDTIHNQAVALATIVRLT